MNGISALIRVMRELASSVCFLSLNNTKRSWQTAAWKRSSPEFNNAGALILDLYAPEL